MFDEISYGYLGHGMDSIIGNIQYKERQLADMRLSLQDYQNDLINKKQLLHFRSSVLKRSEKKIKAKGRTETII